MGYSQIIRKDFCLWWCFKGETEPLLLSLTYIYLKSLFETKSFLRVLLYSVCPRDEGWQRRLRLRSLLFRNLCWEIKIGQHLHYLLPIWIFSCPVCMLLSHIPIVTELAFSPLLVEVINRDGRWTCSGWVFWECEDEHLPGCLHCGGDEEPESGCKWNPGMYVVLNTCL